MGFQVDTWPWFVAFAISRQNIYEVGLEQCLWDLRKKWTQRCFWKRPSFSILYGIGGLGRGKFEANSASVSHLQVPCGCVWLPFYFLFDILSMLCQKFLCLFYFENIPYFHISFVTLLTLVSLYDLKKQIVTIGEISYAPHPVSPILTILH